LVAVKINSQSKEKARIGALTLCHTWKTTPNKMLNVIFLLDLVDEQKLQKTSLTLAASATFFPYWISVSLFNISCQLVTAKTA